MVATREGLADDLQQLGIVLLTSQVLDLEPVDDRQDTATTTSEELEDTIARITEHEAVDTERASEDRYDDHRRGILVINGIDQRELVVIERKQAVLDNEDLCGVEVKNFWLAARKRSTF